MGGIFDFAKKFFGTKYNKDLKLITPIVEKIKLEEKIISSISNDELRQTTQSLKNQINSHIKGEREEIENLKIKAENSKTSFQQKENYYSEIDNLEKEVIEKIEEVLKEILPKAFAVMKETAKRFTNNATIEVTANDFDRELAASKDFISINNEIATYKNSWQAAGNEMQWNMIHYDVQLIGGIVLHEGKIAEMQTGEGKTLVATLPVFLNALTGLGVHLVTVNNYLAKRDCEWMGPLFQFHGLSIDCIDNHQPNSDERRKAYLADITYGTNNEFGFDYLRDNMAKRPDDLVQRKLHYSIVDEVDSVLIDDARTPLIISGPTPKGDVHEYNELKHKVSQLASDKRNMLPQFYLMLKNFLKKEIRKMEVLIY